MEGAGVMSTTGEALGLSDLSAKGAEVMSTTGETLGLSDWVGIAVPTGAGVGFFVITGIVLSIFAQSNLAQSYTMMSAGI